MKIKEKRENLSITENEARNMFLKILIAEPAVS